MQYESLMHHENVRRLKLIPLILLLSVFSSAQDIELQGRYGASFIGGESIEFIGKDSFYFGGFYCTWGHHGKGTCEIRNGYLYLKFENVAEAPKNEVQRETLIVDKGNKDSICDIEIFCRDYNDLPLMYASVILEQPGYLRRGEMADIDGRAHIRVNNRKPITLKTSAAGFETQTILLNKPSDYILTIFHKGYPIEDKELNKGEVFIYKIESVSEDLIVMRPDGSTGDYRQYRKKK
jgi:hypothetical protein